MDVSTPSLRVQKFAIICTQWNREITDCLLSGAKRALDDRAGDVVHREAAIYWVSGAFEIPAFARLIAQSYHVVICLGAVIRGETDHYTYVAGESARLIAQASYDTGVPVMYGVLATQNRAQAWSRAQDSKENKGYEAVIGAIETLAAYASFRGISG